MILRFSQNNPQAPHTLPSPGTTGTIILIYSWELNISRKNRIRRTVWLQGVGTVLPELLIIIFRNRFLDFIICHFFIKII